MTISIAWVRRNRGTIELLMASDCRLRSRGAIDQSQKLFPLLRGDCCLSFTGDTHISYPLFMQIGSALNNYIKTRTRAKDVTELADQLRQMINAYVSSWDFPKAEKTADLENTKLLFGGWSWRAQRFDIGVFQFTDSKANFISHHFKMGHPWREKHRSIVFIGDYKQEYRAALIDVLERHHGKPKSRGEKRAINLNYEPIEALHQLLKSAEDKGLTAIGGAPQVVKVYPYESNLPFAVRTSGRDTYLLGRKLLSWEKTEHPILDLSKSTTRTLYPMAHIPVAAEVTKSTDP